MERGKMIEHLVNTSHYTGTIVPVKFRLQMRKMKLRPARVAQWLCTRRSQYDSLSGHMFLLQA